MNKTHKGLANTTNSMPKTKWKLTLDDTSNGAVLDTERPSTNGPYSSALNQQIGPQSKTGFGRNRK